MSEQIAKRMFWLAWQACGGPIGMGALQDRQGVTEDDVWVNVMSAGDYPGSHTPRKDLNPYGDYVFGRMMKLGLAIDGNKIILPKQTPQQDYQAWCGKYPTYQKLHEAAVSDLKEEKE